MFRVALIGIVGGAVSIAALALARTSSGFVEAGSFLAAVFIVPVTIGLAIAAGVHGVEEWRAAVPAANADVASSVRTRRRWMRRESLRPRTVRCSTCGERMTRLQLIWICGLCDSIAVEADPRAGGGL